MSKVIHPLFSTSASLKQGGTFTVDKPPGTNDPKRVYAPASLCTLAKEEGLKSLTLVEDRFVNFMLAYKNLKSVGCNLRFGLKLAVCDDMLSKTEESTKTESKVVIFMRADSLVAYQKLIRIFSVAANDGFYYIPRIDWKTLKRMWHDDLLLALPFYSSFLAINTLTFNAVVPDLPASPLVLKEVGQELPFDDLINVAVDKYIDSTGADSDFVKSIYYKKRADAKNYVGWQCILKRASYDKPNLDGCHSKEFSWESYKEIVT